MLNCLQLIGKEKVRTELPLYRKPWIAELKESPKDPFSYIVYTPTHEFPSLPLIKKKKYILAISIIWMIPVFDLLMKKSERVWNNKSETKKAAWKTDMLHLALMCQAIGQLDAGQTAGLSAELHTLGLFTKMNGWRNSPRPSWWKGTSSLKFHPEFQSLQKLNPTLQRFDDISTCK